MKFPRIFLFTITLTFTLSSCDFAQIFIDQDAKLMKDMKGEYEVVKVEQGDFSSNDGGNTYNGEYEETDGSGSISFENGDINTGTGELTLTIGTITSTNSFESTFYADDTYPTVWLETTDGSDIKAFVFNSQPASIIEVHIEELDPGKSFVLREGWSAWDASQIISRKFYFEKK